MCATKIILDSRICWDPWQISVFISTLSTLRGPIRASSSPPPLPVEKLCFYSEIAETSSTSCTNSRLNVWSWCLLLHVWFWFMLFLFLIICIFSISVHSYFSLTYPACCLVVFLIFDDLADLVWWSCGSPMCLKMDWSTPVNVSLFCSFKD